MEKYKYKKVIFENGEEYTVRIPTKPKPKLNTNWCECRDKFEFSSYPEDGECTCGLYKHHVHCTCGSISQVG